MNEKEKQGLSDLERVLAVNLEFLPRDLKRMTRDELAAELSKYAKRLKTHTADIFYIVVAGPSEFEINSAVALSKYCRKAIKIISLELAKRAA